MEKNGFSFPPSPPPKPPTKLGFFFLRENMMEICTFHKKQLC